MHFLKGRWIIGVAIIIIGLALLSSNLGIYEFDISNIITIMIAIALVIWGLEFIIKRSSIGATVFGIIILLVGINMFGERMDWFGLNIDLSYLRGLIGPIILIFIGLKMLFSFKGSDRVAFWSGIEIGGNSWRLEDSSYTAFMGGIDIDFSTAEIPDGETKINLTVVMGGMDIFVPDNVNVVCNGSFILGGFEFFDKGSGGIIATAHKERQVNSNKTIIFNCEVALGGIDVKVKNLQRNNIK